ncbi:hypothetical protein, partial [Mycobacterium tuberculosis]|uniref:hypothetical protein n=1 Tax=Mycobacterium tuberculosis TaxID=1773 RepID=UPI00254D628D
KILFGSMHIKSYDWVDLPQGSNEAELPSHIQGRNIRLAKVVVDREFTAPCATNILYPSAGGNMHCFTAKTACAVLDVLGPPYDDSAKRHCAYYNEFPCSNFPGNHGIASTE